MAPNVIFRRMERGALLSPIDSAREGRKADVLQPVCIGQVQTTPAAYRRERPGPFPQRFQKAQNQRKLRLESWENFLALENEKGFRDGLVRKESMLGDWHL